MVVLRVIGFSLTTTIVMGPPQAKVTLPPPPSRAVKAASSQGGPTTPPACAGATSASTQQSSATKSSPNVLLRKILWVSAMGMRLVSLSDEQRSNILHAFLYLSRRAACLSLD